MPEAVTVAMAKPVKIAIKVAVAEPVKIAVTEPVKVAVVEAAVEPVKAAVKTPMETAAGVNRQEQERPKREAPSVSPASSMPIEQRSCDYNLGDVLIMYQRRITVHTASGHCLNRHAVDVLGCHIIHAVVAYRVYNLLDMRV